MEVDDTVSMVLPAGDYSQVIVKAGAGTYANTVFGEPPTAGQTVWADTNGDGVFNPGGRRGDKDISHLIYCPAQPGPNEPPVAQDDAYTLDEDTTLAVPAPGVLGNDTDPDADPLTAAAGRRRHPRRAHPEPGRIPRLHPGRELPRRGPLHLPGLRHRQRLRHRHRHPHHHPRQRPTRRRPGGPYTGTVDQPVAFDGSGSYDIDGTIDSFDVGLRRRQQRHRARPPATPTPPPGSTQSP